MDDETKMRLSSQPKFKVMDSMNVWNMRDASTTFTETIYPPAKPHKFKGSLKQIL
jgi:hypothetical protein